MKANRKNLQIFDKPQQIIYYIAISNRICMNQKEVDVSRESLGENIRFEPINTNSVFQMKDILKMLKEPENMKHLAGISSNAKMEDLVKHYEDGRIGIVALNSSGGVIGVCDISSQGPQVIEAGDKAWQILSGSLGRVCISTERQKKGMGTKLVEYAEEVGLKRHTSLRAGIILDGEQKEKYDQAIERDAEKEFREWFKENDARGKLFLRNRGWRYIGVLRDQGGITGGTLDYVLIAEKTRKDFEENRV